MYLAYTMCVYVLCYIYIYIYTPIHTHYVYILYTGYVGNNLSKQPFIYHISYYKYVLYIIIIFIKTQDWHYCTHFINEKMYNIQQGLTIIQLNIIQLLCNPALIKTQIFLRMSPY